MTASQVADHRHLDELTTTDLVVAKARCWLLAVPLGSTEQHGPHLPLSTDTIVAVELCRRLASGRRDVVVSAPIGFGSSGEHAGFAGTISIGQDALELLLVELGRSAVETFDHVLFVSGHGGNAEAAGRAVRTLVAESRDVHLYLPRVEGDLHAGRSETSMLLAIAPELVHADRSVPGDTRPLCEIWPQLRSSGVAAVSATGVLGDPTDANADEGASLLDAITADLLRDVEGWRGGVSA